MVRKCPGAFGYYILPLQVECCGGQNVEIVSDGDNGMLVWYRHIPGINSLGVDCLVFPPIYKWHVFSSQFIRFCLEYESSNLEMCTKYCNTAQTVIPYCMQFHSSVYSRVLFHLYCYSVMSSHLCCRQFMIVCYEECFIKINISQDCIYFVRKLFCMIVPKIHNVSCSVQTF